MTDASTSPVASQFPLLRPLSIISLVAMLLTASVFMFLYQQDQRVEHEQIFARDGETSVMNLMHSLNDQVYTLVETSNGLDTKTIRTNLDFTPFVDSQEIFRRFGILKLKFYNQPGATIYSSAKEEIGEVNRHPDMLERARQGEVTHRLEFRNTFLSAIGERHDVNVALTYMPLSHNGKRIGSIEIYVDVTAEMARIHDKTIQVGLIVFFAFALQYAALFFYVRKAARTYFKPEF